VHLIPLHDVGGQRTYAVILEIGEEAVQTLKQLAREQQWQAAQFTGLGAVSDAVLAFFNWETREYERIPVREQVEVLTLTGDIALADGAPKVHAHVVLGRRDGQTIGGHLMEAHVRPTLEIALTVSPVPLVRRRDRESGLDLIAGSDRPDRAKEEQSDGETHRR
jgi:predicted DNA-binding protein with PD1-like motif